MFHDTRPAELSADGSADPWAPFRVSHPQERLALLRELRDGSVPVILSAPGGASLTTSLWAMDQVQERLNFSAEHGGTQVERLVEADEAVAVAYLDSVKLQFELSGFVLVHGVHSATLQCRLPRDIYRFQRRNAYRVRTLDRYGPVARLRHPSLPEMQLALRVIDVSVGGCALWLPPDVPPLQAGTRMTEVAFELDADTHFRASLTLQHVSSVSHSERHGRGERLGCEWLPLGGGADRVLQRWIDRAQKRRRLLQLG